MYNNELLAMPMCNCQRPCTNCGRGSTCQNQHPREGEILQGEENGAGDTQPAGGSAAPPAAQERELPPRESWRTTTLDELHEPTQYTARQVTLFPPSNIFEIPKCNAAKEFTKGNTFPLGDFYSRIPPPTNSSGSATLPHLTCRRVPRTWKPLIIASASRGTTTAAAPARDNRVPVATSPAARRDKRHLTPTSASLHTASPHPPLSVTAPSPQRHSRHLSHRQLTAPSPQRHCTVTSASLHRHLTRHLSVTAPSPHATHRHLTRHLSVTAPSPHPHLSRHCTVTSRHLSVTAPSPYQPPQRHRTVTSMSPQRHSTVTLPATSASPHPPPHVTAPSPYQPPQRHRTVTAMSPQRHCTVTSPATSASLHRHLTRHLSVTASSPHPPPQRHRTVTERQRAVHGLVAEAPSDF
ncbi:hypothetical protein C7M84_007314 [Penaeus vannamei]|uniref:Uncharacterized protein n=1 Tax=Penaeus vannamei TaxID=6689 RepID=A0A3R7MEF8_PENVA|nr:hypothetical protein C7M84_007314 [Penaeus vannamei]